MRPITFAPYDPMTDETNWEIGTEEKGTCYAIKRAETGGLICKLPYGLRTQEKALAEMFVKLPEMVEALKKAKALMENPDPEFKDANEVHTLICKVLSVSN
jgi:23S rRNA G2445 N2-methylase RlmL